MGYTSFSFAPDENLVVDKILKYICDIIIMICFALFVMTFFCHQVEVVGNSMSPSLVNDQKVFVNTLIYNVVSPERGDVIVFDVPQEKGEKVSYIKRIIAVEGDSVIIKGGTIYVNDEPYKLKEDTMVVNAGNAGQRIVLEKNEFFVIGDNINNSEDSRFSTVGIVSKDEIIGKVWMVCAPFKSIKPVK